MRPPSQAGCGGRLFANHPGDFNGAGRPEVKRLGAAKQFVQKHAKSIDIGRSRNAFAAHLRGAGILGRHHAVDGAGLRSFGSVGGEQFCDSKIEQLRRAFGIDDDVAGLNVAVNDEMFVRVLNSTAYCAEEL